MRIIEPWFRFGNLTVLKETEPKHFPNSKYPVRRFLCQCDCWNMSEVSMSHFKITKSCWCYRRIAKRKVYEYNKETNKQTNMNNILMDASILSLWILIWLAISKY